VIDIGLFDPRGSDFPGDAGFRGWSGSARQEFTIAPTEATPGYLPGPLPAGRYQIILGLYRIWSKGADYEIEVQADLGASTGLFPPSGFSPLPYQAPSATGTPLIWLRGDLQSHSEHSDAKGTLAQLTAKARGLGLDFLSVTDHNTVSHHPHLAAFADHSLLLIPGQEATSYYGHMNIWGTSRWCDFRCRTDADIAAVIQLARASGALCSINHPKTNGPPWEYGLDLSVDAIEVWQGPWPWHNAESLALWERSLTAGRRLTAVGSSDYHCPSGEETGFLRLGQPTSWVKATGWGVSEVLEAIRAGRVSISAMPEGPRLDLRATSGGVTVPMGGELSPSPGVPVEVEVEVERGAGWTLRLIADGEIAHEIPITLASATVRIPVRGTTYLRAELVGDAPRELIPPGAPPDLDLRGWRWALTNPVYLGQKRMEA
jgi:hypothetical protein